MGFVQNIRHTGIVVENLDASLHFYRDLLGFEITKQMNEKGNYIDQITNLEKVNVTTIKMTSPDGHLIELLYYQTHPRIKKNRRMNDIGIAHIAFTVNDLNKVYSSLSNQGVYFNAPPQLSPDGYAKVTFCRAPEGTYIELVEVL